MFYNETIGVQYAEDLPASIGRKSAWSPSKSEKSDGKLDVHIHYPIHRFALRLFQLRGTAHYSPFTLLNMIP